MSYEHQKRFIRLWSGSCSFLEHGSPRVLAPSKKKVGGSEFSVPSSKTTPHRTRSRGHKKIKCPSNHSQPPTPRSGRMVSSAGPSRQRGLLITGPTPPPRSHSSLGFREKPLPCLQGFDLQGYVKRHGSTSEIRIGINGNASSDEYFERYLKECESKAEQKRDGPCSIIDLDTIDITEQSEERMETERTHPLRSHLVPLCWEDQLKKAEVCYYLLHIFA